MSRESGLRRVGAYGTAIAWIVMHDDNAWLAAAERDLKLSVAARLVAGVFARTDEEIVHDLRDAMKRFGKVTS